MFFEEKNFHLINFFWTQKVEKDFRMHYMGKGGGGNFRNDLAELKKLFQSFQTWVNVIDTFESTVTTLLRNNAFWLAKTSCVTCNIPIKLLFQGRAAKYTALQSSS